VQSDGHFAVGPSDTGATLSGSVTSSERDQLSADAAVVSASLTTTERCDLAQAVPGVGDRVDLLDARSGAVAVYQAGVSGVCYRSGRDAALKLHSDLALLMAKYYPRPFPPA
jgi:hypothetical protein